ncbi:EamA family transporter [Bradyrhizobium sp. U87765 SZCCT0131]|uniref:EamA family transporter n=1 Tax=unclassified Bradyrhizobium TaxID=2631580 RepID=UPI001BAA94DC|nr:MULTISPECIES: EamA family transporter [unclassified Bradyrhizobium]MBR1216857.1 EamA family transporter [Bradyrhizobium sp. U87765 SZCCT0131]MBR1259387.1 EamA family transporter [Bradyrhizobium sp. U87765 SZCCT0134]MBR1305528.1 EamA family transporter [Bradyrhizobium sp. U87765 SZCCT0110]MBR1321895.1 EamA family transporter [Bradyrhizobium sp. U87765 SZCCT0109]MBR1350827.1 EamA family transporter [Bradyrhizobium sp. U87765 SZCCT0048]
MTSRHVDLLLTAIAPAIWGSTYLVTTQLLPAGHPMTVAMLRALPAGLLLLLMVRQLPTGVWWLRTALLGILNFSFFWAMLFVAAYRLPGGVAATVGAIQPLVVVMLARPLLGTPIRAVAVLAALGGMAGVALLLLTPRATLDPVGIAAGLAGAVSMALGTVLSRRWQPPVSPLTFTAWQLTAGGVLLTPVALLLETPLTTLTPANVIGFVYLGLIGAALTYILWFRGVARLEPSVVASLGFLSPVTAVVLGWLVLDQSLTATQLIGMAVVVGSVWLSQQAQRPAAARGAPHCRVEAKQG